MSVLFLADRINIKIPLKFKRINLYKTVLFATIISSIYIMYIYKGNLRLVAFQDVYVQRLDNSNLGSDIFTGYLSSWLTTAMIPICLAFGITSKKRIYYIIGSLACLILYMATAAKGTIMLPFIFIAFSVLLSESRINKIYHFFVLSITVMMASMLFFTELNMASSILLSRTIGNGGNLTMWYHDFFLTHPHTYYSHINFIDAITNYYPYKDGLGFTVGRAYWGNDMNANANFWATDGIAAAGMIGVVIISIISYFLFAFMNSVTKNRNNCFVILTFIPFVGSILNTSIFSSLLTGGGILILMFFTLNKFDTKE